MLYHIRHQTTYRYEEPANLGHNLARLRPLDLPTQSCLEHKLSVSPTPDFRSTRIDGFGNHTEYFAIQRPHLEMVITAESRVEVLPQTQLLLETCCAWNEVPALLRASRDPEHADAREFTLASPYIPVSPALAAWAAPDFKPGRPIHEAILALNSRIFTEFAFKPGFTDVTTSVDQVFREKAGVCQDFAHLMIATLRTLGIPARYVSGYLETEPPPGKPKLVGADASHAWVSAFIPGRGWAEFDPTNNTTPTLRHIVTARGRDYGDVSPIRGVTTGGTSHQLKVAVDVTPISPSPSPAPAAKVTS